MKDQCGRFLISTDMNFDGVVTITDVTLIGKYLFLLPSKVVVGIFSQNAELIRFFEITCDSGEGWGGTVFSLIVWSFVFLVVVAIAE